MFLGCFLRAVQILLIGGHRQLITPFVFDMSGMSLDLLIVNGVDLQQLVQTLPEFDVFDGNQPFSVPAFPTVFFPTLHPTAHPLQDVAAVGMERDFTRFAEGLQSANHRGQLHPVVGRFRFTVAAFEFLLRLRAAEDEGPTTRTGIPAACSVGKQADFLHALQVT